MGRGLILLLVGYKRLMEFDVEKINERKYTNKRISVLKSKLEKEMDKNPMDYEKILNISRQLDKLILSYYTKPVKDAINN